MRQINVAQDGSGEFFTIQEAIESVGTQNKEPVVIQIKKGVYKEVVHIPDTKPFITLKGEGAAQTIITSNHFAGQLNEEGEKIGTNNSATVFIDADHVHAEGITFENSYYREGLDSPGRQAVAVNTIGDRVRFTKCAFKGYQDTLYVREGTCYFLDCFIEGDIDFIFGAARAVFEGCQIHSLYGGSKVDNGYVTAASTRAHSAYGFLFENCRLTASSDMPEKTVYLGRPWHPSKREAPICVSTVFKRCYLGPHIKEEGWTVMGDVSPETERLYEYENTGEGAYKNVQRRQLSVEEIGHYTKENILGW